MMLQSINDGIKFNLNNIFVIIIMKYSTHVRSEH